MPVANRSEPTRGPAAAHETGGISRLLFLIVGGALAATAAAWAGGIADEPCPTVAGEHTNTCPAGTVGVPYRVQFREKEGSGCGPGRQSFHHDSGEVPPGLLLESNGRLNGIPLAPGRFQFYVEMREPQDDPASCAGKRTQKQFTLWVRAPIAITTRPSVPGPAEVGVSLRTAFRARGGTGVFRWASARLPRGLRLRPDGSLVGTPRRPGDYRLIVRATDTEARVGTRETSLQVAPRLVASVAPLRAALLGRRYRVRFVVRGGVQPVRWQVARGRLPRGLALDSRSGNLLGTPTEVGAFRVVLVARDRLDVTATRIVTLVVQPRAAATSNE